MLGECAIDNEDFEHESNLWEYFECQTLDVYSDLYLKRDLKVDVMSLDLLKTLDKYAWKHF